MLPNGKRTYVRMFSHKHLFICLLLSFLKTQNSAPHSRSFSFQSYSFVVGGTLLKILIKIVELENIRKKSAPFDIYFWPQQPSVKTEKKFIDPKESPFISSGEQKEYIGTFLWYFFMENHGKQGPIA